MKSLILLLCLVPSLAPRILSAQSHSKAAPRENAQTEAYEKASFLGERQIKIFSDDPRRASFFLFTSWIPGMEHKGYFRYQISANITDQDLATKPVYSSTPPRTGWSVSATINRLHNCILTLDVYDSGGFILQKIPLVFIRNVDAQDAVTGLSANDSTQMDLNNYQSFLAASSDNSWNILWVCPDEKDE